MMNDALLCCFNTETLLYMIFILCHKLFLDAAKLEIMTFLHNTQK